MLSRYAITKSDLGYRIYDSELKGYVGKKSGLVIWWRTEEAANKYLPNLPK